MQSSKHYSHTGSHLEASEFRGCLLYSTGEFTINHKEDGYKCCRNRQKSCITWLEQDGFLRINYTEREKKTWGGRGRGSLKGNGLGHCLSNSLLHSQVILHSQVADWVIYKGMCSVWWEIHLHCDKYGIGNVSKAEFIIQLHSSRTENSNQRLLNIKSADSGTADGTNRRGWSFCNI